MKLDESIQKKLIWDALEKSDGDRKAAADALGMSLRTLYRHPDKLDMYPKIELMWGARPGPAKRGEQGLTTMRLLTVAAIRESLRNSAKIDYKAVTEAVYGIGQDNPTNRQRIYTQCDVLKRLGYLRFAADGNWEIVEEKIREAQSSTESMSRRT